MEYQAYLREAYHEEVSGDELPVGELDEIAREEAGVKFAEENPQLPVRKLIQAFEKATWLDDMLMQQERAAFFKRTNLTQLRPQAHIASSVPGQFSRLLEQINVHRWYLGVQRNREMSFEDAVVSWYDQVYLPSGQDHSETRYPEGIPWPDRDRSIYVDHNQTVVPAAGLDTKGTALKQSSYRKTIFGYILSIVLRH